MDKLKEETDRNREFFLQELPGLLEDHGRRYALLRNRAITGFFYTIMDVKTAGDLIYPDGIYSIEYIQENSAVLAFQKHRCKCCPWSYVQTKESMLTMLVNLGYHEAVEALIASSESDT